MKTIMLLTAGGPLVILTSFSSPTDPELLKKLEIKGIEKFVGYEIPLELANARYGAHFTAVRQDLHESDDLRVLDYNGQRAFSLFRFEELGEPVFYEAGNATGAKQTVRAAEDVQ